MGRTRLDHLVWGVGDLDSGVRRIEEGWGCAVLPGGRHPRWGSWNAILPLRGGAYLEIVSADPSGEPPPGPRIFGLDSLGDDRLVTWAVRPDDPEGAGGMEGTGERLHVLAGRMGTAGVSPGALLPGERRTPEGTLLKWHLTDPAADRLDGAVPFLIDWGRTPHPSAAAPARVALEALDISHPRPGAVERVLEILGLNDDRIRIVPGPAELSAVFATPRGPRRLPAVAP